MSGETSNAHRRRVREGWYERFASATVAGLDLGSNPDPIHPDSGFWKRWNEADGDAAKLASIVTQYPSVYASHILEDIPDPVAALARWYEVTAPGGHLVVCVPHRDLYERRTELPSRFNGAHRWFYLPDRVEFPVTRSLYHDFRQALPSAIFCRLDVLDAGWFPCPPEQHACGEYSIELICRKPL